VEFTVLSIFINVIYGGLGALTTTANMRSCGDRTNLDVANQQQTSEAAATG